AVGGGRRYPVQVKIDTGMHRAGADPAEAGELADLIDSYPQLVLDGVFTHLAMADEPDAESNALQLTRFDDVLDDMRRRGHHPRVVHAANSAAALALAASRRDLVRLGIAMYGIEPGQGVRGLCAELRPALSLRARVSVVREVVAGEGVSYGLRTVFTKPTVLATIPIGYADGVPRRLSETGGQVLIHGQRLAIVGVVTMDQLVVDCGPLGAGEPVVVGDEVVLLGSQVGPAGSDEIRAEEWAQRLGTIGYEIVCAISSRIERLHHSGSSGRMSVT
ncbi:MAG: alanine racemase, partial [Ilumatobacteraceae bacterium]